MATPIADERERGVRFLIRRLVGGERSIAVPAPSDIAAAAPPGNGLDALPPPRLPTAWSDRWAPWIFSAKAAAAAVLLLLVAFWAGLETPRWGLLTVYVLAQQQSGAVLAKGIFRLVGTAVGAVVALALVGAVAQERTLFLGGITLWVMACAFAARYQRNFEAYATVTAAVTALVIGVAAAQQPQQAFDLALARTTEIALALLCTSIVGGIVLPQSATEALLAETRAAQRALLDYVDTATTPGQQGSALLLRQRELVGHVTAGERLRASAAFETPTSLVTTLRAGSVGAAFLGVWSAARLAGHDLAAFSASAGGEPPAPLRAARDELRAALAGAPAELTNPRTAMALRDRVRRIAERIPAAAAAVLRDARGEDEQDARATAVALARIGLLSDRLARYLWSFAALLGGPPPPAEHRVRRLGIFTDPLLAGLGALRAGLGLAAAAAFWIATAWPDGGTVFVLLGALSVALSIRRNPWLAARQTVFVVTLTIVPVYVLAFVLLPRVHDFVPFVLTILPVLLVAGRLEADMRTYIGGIYVMVIFTLAASPQNTMSYDVVQFLNTALAASIAVTAATLLFLLVAPDSPGFARWLLRRGARRQLLAVTARDTPPDLHVHQAVMAELLTEYGEDLAHEDEEDRRLLSTILATVAVGSAVIRLKRGLREADIPAPLRPMIRDALGDLGRRLRRRDGAPDRMLAHLAEGRAAASAWLKREHLGTAERLATLRALLSLTTIDDGICRHPELFGAAAAGGAPFVQFGRGQDAA